MASVSLISEHLHSSVNLFSQHPCETEKNPQCQALAWSLRQEVCGEVGSQLCKSQAWFTRA